MEIKTKYEVGQALFFIGFDSFVNRWETTLGKMCICSVAKELNDPVIYYSPRSTFLSHSNDWYAESNLFLTTQQAQAECDRRNKKGEVI